MDEKEVNSLSRVVNLSDLATGACGLTSAVTNMYIEAAAVCLESQKHSSGTILSVNGENAEAFLLLWPDPQKNANISLDDEEATEYGACAIAIQLAVVVTKWNYVQRAQKGKGFDYWLSDSHGTGSLFQGKCRLEVSGIRHGSNSDVTGRVIQKIQQISKSLGSELGCVIVVEFSKPQSTVRTL